MFQRSALLLNQPRSKLKVSVLFPKTTFFTALLLPLTGILISARANEKIPDCIQIFRQMNETLQSSYITASTLEKVRALFDDSSLSPKERGEKAFQAVVEDRLQLLDPQEARLVLKFLKSHVFRVPVDSINGINGSFSAPAFSPKKITLTLPKEYQESIVEYAILSHELEHYIQYSLATKTLSDRLGFFFDSLDHLADIKYEREIGAMLSEFQFLNTLPPRMIQEARNEIIHHLEELHPSTLQFLLLLFSAAESTPVEYIQRQHQARRYDRASLKAMYPALSKSSIGTKRWAHTFALSYGSILGVRAVFEGISEVKEFCSDFRQRISKTKDLPSGKAALLQICQRLS